MSDAIRVEGDETRSASPIHPDVQVSFEFFPPHTVSMEQRLWQALARLTPLSPRFVSVTYGAGGTTRQRTHATVRRLLEVTDLTPAAHLTCVGATRTEILDIVRQYRELGVRHLVAIRGDAPNGGRFEPHPDGFRGSLELVEGIARVGGFDVTVGAYPEPHPDAISPSADLDYLKRKIDAGASRAITQFFFDVDVYLRFVERARAAGIGVPIVPGILPVTNFGSVRRFAARCGASIPRWLAELFDGLDDDPNTRQLVAATVAIEQCRKLEAHGVREYHFYTLNRGDLTRSICHFLGVRPAPASEARVA